jgi:signal transduction histidine kinase
MAEAVVSTGIVGDAAEEAGGQEDRTTAVGRRLAALTRSVLGCTRVGIITVDEAGLQHPVAVAGLSRELEVRWWAEQENLPLGAMPDPELAARFAAGEPLVIDMTAPPFSNLPNRYGVRTVLVAPLRIGERLIGILSLDYGGRKHEYTEQEVALAGGVAKLAALALERQRLLGERAAAQASALASREAEERMDVFLSIAGHELRTPITSMKATIQLAERQVNSIATPEAIADHDPAELANRLGRVLRQLDRADRQSDRLDRLVGDLLDVSRLQAGQLELRRERTDLCAVVCESVEEQRLLHPERSILCQAPSDEVGVLVDADRIGQVVTNFLTNALKYSSADRPVAVRVSVEGDAARGEVADEGPGLPPEELERIWERFHRVSSVKQRSSGVGLGLGLYISRGIVERHGGTVGVASEAGRGSTFSFALPLA